MREIEYCSRSTTILIRRNMTMMNRPIDAMNRTRIVGRIAWVKVLTEVIMSDRLMTDCA